VSTALPLFVARKKSVGNFTVLETGHEKRENLCRSLCDAIIGEAGIPESGDGSHKGPEQKAAIEGAGDMALAQGRIHARAGERQPAEHQLRPTRKGRRNPTFLINPGTETAAWIGN